MVVVCHKLLSAGFLRQRKHRQPEVRLGGGRCSARSARRACLSSDTAVLRRIASATSSSVERPVHTGRCEETRLPPPPPARACVCAEVCRAFRARHAVSEGGALVGAPRDDAVDPAERPLRVGERRDLLLERLLVRPHLRHQLHVVDRHACSQPGV